MADLDFASLCGERRLLNSKIYTEYKERKVMGPNSTQSTMSTNSKQVLKVMGPNSRKIRKSRTKKVEEVPLVVGVIVCKKCVFILIVSEYIFGKCFDINC